LPTLELSLYFKVRRILWRRLYGVVLRTAWSSSATSVVVGGGCFQCKYSLRRLCVSFSIVFAIIVGFPASPAVGESELHREKWDLYTNLHQHSIAHYITILYTINLE
jgi:hypothetical protein